MASRGHLFLHHQSDTRRRNNLLIRNIDRLRDTVHRVRRDHPFDIHGWVVLQTCGAIRFAIAPYVLETGMVDFFDGMPEGG